MSALKRYRVSVSVRSDDAFTLQLLIPFRETETVSALAEVVKARAAKHGYSALDPEISLRLDGYVLDPDDILEEVVDPTEAIHVTFENAVISASADTRARVVSIPTHGKRHCLTQSDMADSQRADPPRAQCPAV